jgi:sulfopyruvate decarboxylase alpha subunit
VSWQEEIYQSLRLAGIRQVPYVPDAGHAHVISRIGEDPEMQGIVLTSEEEGIAVSCGAWLGGERSALLMQSSGVGNCINMLSLASNCSFPLLMLVTMRGEWEEFNSWQCPMSRATQGSLQSMLVEVVRCDREESVKPVLDNAIAAVFEQGRRIAILLSQQLIGAKQW